MTPECANPGEIHNDIGARQRLKCHYCRRDKQKCEPVERQWPEKCARCIKKNRACGPNERAVKPMRSRRRRPRSSNPSMTSSLTSQHEDFEAFSQPRITLDANDGEADEAADTQNAHLIVAERSQSTSLLQIPAATSAESGSPVTESGDEHSLEELYSIRVFHEICIRFGRALLPRNVTQHDLNETLRVSNDLEQMAACAMRELRTRCTQMIDGLEEEDKSTVEQQYNEILICIECEHTKKRSDILADAWKRLLQKLIKAKLTNGRHFGACLLRIKLNDSSMISTSPSSRQRLIEWCDCVFECSKQLAIVDDNLKLTSGSVYSSTNPAPPLHLALILQLEPAIFSKMISMRVDSLRERDLLNRNILHVAAEYSNSTAIEYIFTYTPEEAANLIHERDRVLRTPILVAAYLGDLKCFTLLADAGANVHDLDIGSLGVLELACRAGNRDIAELLLCRRTDFHPDGRVGPHAPNPLHNAAKGNSRDVCELLLAQGADAGMTDLSTGKTAAKLAYDHGHHELAWILSDRDGSGLSKRQLENPEWLNQLGLDQTSFVEQFYS